MASSAAAPRPASPSSSTWPRTNRTSSRARATARGTTRGRSPRYEGRFAGLRAPRPPGFNEADVSDKPADIGKLPLLTPHQKAEIDALYRAQARSLLAVDDLVQNVVRTLKQEGVLNNTVILFTSDNGFLHGEHRVLQGKVLPYEPSIRVPLEIRAPGVPQGVHRRQLVENVDLTPTILDFAHANPGRVQDGQSLVPIMRQPRYSPGRGLELEAWGNPSRPSQANDPPLVFKGVRTDRYMYARYGSGEQELYDLREDPFELRNAANDPAYARVRASLQSLLGVLGRLRRRDLPGHTRPSPAGAELLERAGHGERGSARGDLLSGRQEDRQRLEAADPDQLPRHGRRRPRGGGDLARRAHGQPRAEAEGLLRLSLTATA